MGFLGWIILGLLAGLIAKALMPGRDPGGVIITILIGIVGAVLGGWLGSVLLGVSLENFWSLTTWLLAIAGSVILLVIYRLATGRRSAV